MAAKYSTGLRNGMLVTGSLKSLLETEACVMRLYGGAVPATADAALGAATPLSEVSNDATGDGLEFDAAAAAGVLSKNPSQIWRGVNSDSGVATFFRIEEPDDDGTLSTTRRRIQGTIGTAGADLNLSSVNLVASASQAVNFFSVSLPTN